MKRLLSMRFPDAKLKALTLSYDDGVKQDERFMEILDRHGLKCTFNLNSGCYPPEKTVHRRLTRERCIELYKNSPHEVAVHGLTHPFLERLTPANIAYEIIKDRESLENDFECIVRGMAYPYGTYSDEVVETLKACGIVYARTTKSTETFDIPTDWLRMPATCHHNNPRLMELAREFVEKPPARKKAQLFYLWGHTYEFDDKDNWNIIEEFAEYMGGREEIWYATNIEIFEYIEDFNRLIFSVDAMRVKNPTARTLWFRFDNKVFSIDAGETICLLDE